MGIKMWNSIEETLKSYSFYNLEKLKDDYIQINIDIILHIS